MAIGIPPMRSTRRLSIPGRYFLSWMGYMTISSITIPIAIEHMQKFPIAVKTCTMWNKNESKPKSQKYILELNKDHVTIISPCLLEVADLVSCIHKVSSLPKEGVDTSGNNYCFNLSLFASRTRVNTISRTFCHGKGLTSKCRLRNQKEEGSV